MNLLQRLVAPLHGDLSGLGLVGLLHHHLDKLRLIQLRVHHHILSLLDIQAGTDDQLRIFS